MIIMKKLLALLVPGAFILGAYCSDEIKETKSLLNYRVSETGYERPYNIRILTVEGREGIETYLHDPVSGESKRILRGMELEHEYTLTDSVLDIIDLFK